MIMMTHLRVATVSIAAGVLALGIAAPFQAQTVQAQTVQGPKVEWNFGMYGNKRAATAGFEELARLVGEATNGNFNIKINYGETLGPSKEALDAIKIGAYEMTLAVSGFTPGKLPVTEGMGLPFLPTPTIYHVLHMRQNFMKHPTAQAEIAAWGGTLITPMPIGANEFLGKGKVPQTLADWKGLRVRALSGDAKAMRLIGAVPQNVPTPETYGALERGLLDAASTLYYAHAAFRTHEVTDWYTTNMALSSAPSLVLASTTAFGALPPQYQKLVMDSVKPSNDFWIEALLDGDRKAVELFNKEGLKPVTISEKDLATLREMVKPIYQEWIADMDKRGHKGQELFDHLIKSAQSYKGA